jgi:RimJ/RimL family protein N-acetyltransferase
MLHPPILKTDRLLLRPFAISDAEQVRLLAGDRRVYETTSNIPHPYEDGMAEQWIASHASTFYGGRGLVLAVTRKEDGVLMGTVSLGASKPHQRAELGYWLGVPYWGEGYCTEAAGAIVAYGFETLGYHKITSRYLETNPASGRVMEKLGMQQEGTLVDEFLKDGRFHTIIVYGLVRASS